MHHPSCDFSNGYVICLLQGPTATMEETAHAQFPAQHQNMYNYHTKDLCTCAVDVNYDLFTPFFNLRNYLMIIISGLNQS